MFAEYAGAARAEVIEWARMGVLEVAQAMKNSHVDKFANAAPRFIEPARLFKRFGRRRALRRFLPALYNARMTQGRTRSRAHAGGGARIILPSKTNQIYVDYRQKIRRALNVRG